MKTIEYTYRQDEHVEWGVGPWLNEVDKMQWTDEATGLPCLVVRNRRGAWCGYVCVDESHPLFNVDSMDADLDTDVHGGLTFSGFCAPDDKEHGICHIVEPGENDRVWWFGFDCNHWNDYAPALEARMRKRDPDEEPLNQLEQYKTIEYAKKEVRNLAKELARS